MPHCITPHKLREDEKELMELKPAQIRAKYVNLKAAICVITLDIRQNGHLRDYNYRRNPKSMIHRHECMHMLESYLRPHNLSIREDGFKRVLAGDTSLAEILRVTSQC